MSKNDAVTIIIPAVNEEKTISRMIKDSLKYSPLKTFILVVLDSKTKDNTEKIAKEAGAKVINIGRGRGKGYAFRKAIPLIKTKYCVQIDADYQFLPKDLKKMITPLQHDFDLTLGTRYQTGANVEDGSVTTLKRFGSYFLSFATSVASMHRITDVMAGYKGFRTASLKKINPKTDHFGYEAELVIKAAQKKMKIVNVPIGYKKRLVGASNVDSFKHGFLVLQTIINSAVN